MDHSALSDLNQSKSLQAVLAISYFYYRQSVVSGNSSNKNLHSHRALAIRICSSGFKKNQHPVAVVPGASNQPGTRRRPQGAGENFPSEIL
jgi:hypothetical protein